MIIWETAKGRDMTDDIHRLIYRADYGTRDEGGRSDTAANQYLGMGRTKDEYNGQGKGGKDASRNSPIRKYPGRIPALS